jgi:hypothetical protein
MHFMPINRNCASFYRFIPSLCKKLSWIRHVLSIFLSCLNRFIAIAFIVTFTFFFSSFMIKADSFCTYIKMCGVDLIKLNLKVEEDDDFATGLSCDKDLWDK